jgi:hypothetical protein
LAPSNVLTDFFELWHTDNRMFKKLTDFTYVRSSNEALGFYLAYLLFIVILSAVVSGLFVGIGYVYPGQGIRTGMRLGTAVAITCSVALSLLIISQKKLAGSFGYIVLSLVAGLLASFGGGLFGLIIPAVLTTKKVKGKKK